MNEVTQKIWILLDSQRDQFDLLTTAATLASQMKAHIQGLFIEEENLIRAADLSLSSEISFLTAQEHQITSKSVLRLLRTKACQKQKELENITQQKGVVCSFQTIRGERIPWILENKNTTDILFIPRREMIFNHGNSLKQHNLVKGPLLVLYDGSSASQRALKIASTLSKASARPIIALLVIDTKISETELRGQVETSLRGDEASTTIFLVSNNEQIIKTQKRLQAHMLVLPNDLEWIHSNGYLEKLLQGVICPVVLVH